jgi:ribonuclease BN (tRNA processing enzyme)
MRNVLICLFQVCLFWAWLTPVSAAEMCGSKGIVLQVLGSGGPELQDRRASSSYLIWQDGKARVLIDSGGGSALRFGESGALVDHLDVVLFTHLHIDHSADFPALIKSSYFENRTRPLPVYGPAGNEFFPGINAFVDGLFNAQTGAYRYLGAFIGSADKGTYKIQPHDVPATGTAVVEVFRQNGMRIFAASTIHARVPALAWRVEVGGKTIVFSGDTNGDNGNLEKIAKGADIFVAHNAVPEGAAGIERKLHMPPSVIGHIAHTADVKQLVLSHRMLRTLGKEQETQQVIAQSYSGPLNFADDLSCYTLQ